jgi:hypothetical protein
MSANAAAVLAAYKQGVPTANVAERAMWGVRLADALESLLATGTDTP